MYSKTVPWDPSNHFEKGIVAIHCENDLPSPAIHCENDLPAPAIRDEKDLAANRAGADLPPTRGGVDFDAIPVDFEFQECCSLPFQTQHSVPFCYLRELTHVDHFDREEMVSEKRTHTKKSKRNNSPVLIS